VALRDLGDRGGLPHPVDAHDQGEDRPPADEARARQLEEHVGDLVRQDLPQARGARRLLLERVLPHPLDQLQRGLDPHVGADQDLFQILERALVERDLAAHRGGDLVDDLRVGHEEPALQLPPEPLLLLGLLGEAGFGRELQDVVLLGIFGSHSGAMIPRPSP
jgi:hypothetical protein